jgi:hypothetical protein
MNAKLEQLKKDEAVAWENVQSAQKIVNAAMAVWSPIFQERRREEIREELRKEKPEN